MPKNDLFLECLDSWFSGKIFGLLGETGLELQLEVRRLWLVCPGMERATISVLQLKKVESHLENIHFKGSYPVTFCSEGVCLNTLITSCLLVFTIPIKVIDNTFKYVRGLKLTLN